MIRRSRRDFLKAAAGTAAAPILLRAQTPPASQAVAPQNLSGQLIIGCVQVPIEQVPAGVATPLAQLGAAPHAPVG